MIQYLDFGGGFIPAAFYYFICSLINLGGVVMKLNEQEYSEAIERLRSIVEENGGVSGGESFTSRSTAWDLLKGVQSGLKEYQAFMKSYALCSAGEVLKSDEFTSEWQVENLYQELENRMVEIDDLFDKHRKNVDDIQSDLFSEVLSVDRGFYLK